MMFEPIYRGPQSGQNCDRWEVVDFGHGPLMVRCTQVGRHTQHICEVWFLDEKEQIEAPHPTKYRFPESAAKDDGQVPYDNSSNTKDSMEPNLGLATTEQLLREVISRLEMSRITAVTAQNSTSISQNVRAAIQISEILGRLDAATCEYRTVMKG